MKKDRIYLVISFLFMFGILFNTTEIMAQEWLQDNLAIQKVVADQITNGENTTLCSCSYWKCERHSL